MPVGTNNPLVCKDAQCATTMSEWRSPVQKETFHQLFCVWPTIWTWRGFITLPALLDFDAIIPKFVLISVSSQNLKIQTLVCTRAQHIPQKLQYVSCIWNTVAVQQVLCYHNCCNSFSTLQLYSRINFFHNHFHTVGAVCWCLACVTICGVNNKLFPKMSQVCNTKQSMYVMK